MQWLIKFSLHTYEVDAITPILQMRKIQPIRHFLIKKNF